MYVYVIVTMPITNLTPTHTQDQQGAAGQAGGQGGAAAGGGGAGGEENPLTPTKEEAATALASLSAEDHEAAG